MKLMWDAQEQSWISNVSRAGPAGAAAINIGGAWVEFDRVDGGRIVSLVVPVESDSGLLLGRVAETLQAPPNVAEDADFEIDIEVNDSPLWESSRELSLAAELAEDAERLVKVDLNAATVAYLELAQVLKDLGRLAPAEPVSVLERALNLRRGLLEPRLAIADPARERFDALLAALRTWAPESMHRDIRALQPAAGSAVL